MSFPVEPIAVAFMSPAFYAWSVIFDNFTGEKFKDNLLILICIASLFGFLFFLPFLLYVQPVLTMSWPLFGFVVLISFLELAYLYPYFLSLRYTDTSIVTALFSIGRIFIPVLAAIFLKEKLTSLQYVGFFLIVSAGFLLTFDWQKFRFNRSIFYMFISSGFLAVDAVVTKHVLEEGVAWQAVAFWINFLHFLFALGILAVCFSKVKGLWHSIGRKTRFFVGAEAFTSIIGGLGAEWAAFLLPISIAKAINSTQPLFILAYAKFFHKVLPDTFKEGSATVHPRVKFLGLLLMVVGGILAVV